MRRAEPEAVLRRSRRAAFAVCALAAACCACQGSSNAPRATPLEPDGPDAGRTLPDVTELAFLRSELGPRTLVAGTAPDDDVAFVQLTFLGPTGDAVNVDLNGDSNPDTSEFELQTTGLSRSERFFVTLQSAAGFEDGVAGISARAANAAGLFGAARLTSLADPKLVPLSAPCDVRGFDRCDAAGVCVPAASDVQGVCRSGPDLRRAACSAAQRLNPFAGVTRVSGTLGRVSLYDPPRGCISESASARLDSVVVLKLTRPARSVTLWTDPARTDFDSVLYVIKSCTDDPRSALACNDDTPPGPASSIELSQLAAGEYSVVVDSLGEGPGNYVLLVSVQ
jgi:hypothetical protein